MTTTCPTCGKREQGARVVTDCGFPGPHPDVWTIPTDAEREVTERAIRSWTLDDAEREAVRDVFRRASFGPQDVLDALAPHVAAREAQAAERALREAADAVERSERTCRVQRTCHQADAILLRERAIASATPLFIERGES